MERYRSADFQIGASLPGGAKFSMRSVNRTPSIPTQSSENPLYARLSSATDSRAGVKYRVGLLAFLGEIGFHAFLSQLFIC